MLAVNSQQNAVDHSRLSCLIFVFEFEWLWGHLQKHFYLQENIRPNQRSSASESAEKTRPDRPTTPGLSERVDNLPAVRPAEDKSADIVRHLSEVSRKLDTLTQTVLYMEKRLCLVEEQIKLVTNSNSSGSTQVPVLGQDVGLAWLYLSLDGIIKFIRWK